MGTIEENIETLELKLEVAKALQKADPNKTTPMQQLAQELHKLLCRWDHTEGCSWEYEINKTTTDWTRYAHKEYFTKAVVFSKENPNIPLNELTKIIQTLQTTKNVK